MQSSRVPPVFPRGSSVRLQSIPARRGAKAARGGCEANFARQSVAGGRQPPCELRPAACCLAPFRRGLSWARLGGRAAGRGSCRQGRPWPGEECGPSSGGREQSRGCAAPRLPAAWHGLSLERRPLPLPNRWAGGLLPLDGGGGGSLARLAWPPSAALGESPAPGSAGWAWAAR